VGLLFGGPNILGALHFGCRQNFVLMLTMFVNLCSQQKIPFTSVGKLKYGIFEQFGPLQKE